MSNEKARVDEGVGRLFHPHGDGETPGAQEIIRAAGGGGIGIDVRRISYIKISAILSRVLRRVGDLSQSETLACSK